MTAFINSYGLQNWHCAPCGRSFGQERVYKQHLKSNTHHRNIGQPSPRGFECTSCGKLFTRDSDSRRHQVNRQCRQRMALPLLDVNPTRGSATANALTQQVHPNVGVRLERGAQTNTLPSEAGQASSSFGSQTQPGILPPSSNLGSSLIKSSSCWTPRLQSMTNQTKPHSNGFDPGEVYQWLEDYQLGRMSYFVSHGTTKAVLPERKSFCAFCSRFYEDIQEDLMVHLRDHLDTFKALHACEVCDIEFVHKQDLKRHQEAVLNGSCGFDFDHRQTCQGHHPPTTSRDDGSFTDRDRFRLCLRLRHWEQNQLKAYIEDISRYAPSRSTSTGYASSVEVLQQVSKASSERSIISVGTKASAPCDKSGNGEGDVHGLKKILLERNQRQPKLRTLQEWQSHQFDYLQYYISSRPR